MTHREHSAKTPSLETGLFAPLRGLLGGTGSGAGSSGGVGRTPSFKLIGLVVAALAAVFALTASPALAKPTHVFREAFGSAGSGAGQLALAPNSGLAVNQTTHDIYVADTNNHRVDQFSEAGTFIRAFGADVGGAGVNVCTTGCAVGTATSAPGGFEAPTFIAVDNSGGGPLGDVYVADTTANLISKFEADGTLISSWATGGQLGPFNSIGGITVNGNGDLDILGGIFEVFRVYEEDGTFKEEFELENPFTSAAGLGVDPDGAFYKVNNNPNVSKFGPTGSEIARINLPDATGNGDSTGLAVDPADGDLYVGTPGSIEAFEFEPSGEVVGASCNPEPEVGCPPTDRFGSGHLTTAAGLAVDATSGVVYAADPGAGKLVVFAPATLPDTRTEAATGVAAHAATLHGTISAAGGPQASCEFQYTTEAVFEEHGFQGASAVACNPPGPFSGSGEEALSADLTDLAAGTAYRFRLVGTNENGSNPASPLGFETPGPQVLAESSTAVTATSATLEAELNPHGLPTTYRFEYDTVPYAEGEETSHGTATPTGSAGSGTADVGRSAQLQGLQPLTTYHYRVVAENSLGSAFGPDHQFTTQGPGSALLPDARAWELVSPPNKHGAPLEPITEEGGLIQAAANGSGLAYVALGPIGPESQGVRSPTNNQLLSARGPAGWSTQDITTPNEKLSIIRAGFGSEYQFFAEDLTAGLVEPRGATPLSPYTTERTPYRREADGEYVPLVVGCPAEPPCPQLVQEHANVPPGTKFGGVFNPENSSSGGWTQGVEFLTATPDAGHVILRSPQLLAAGFEPGFEANGRANLYELSGGVLTLVSVLPGGEPAAEAGLEAEAGFPRSKRGAISNDGNRVFFSAGGMLLMRANATAPQSVSGACDEAGKACTLQIDNPQPGATGGGGEARFQGASADGSRVFFTDASQLTVDANAQPGQPDLYMCEVTVTGGNLGCALTDLSISVNPGEAAGVMANVSAFDPAGTHVYFAARGVLTKTPNPQGEQALPAGGCFGGETTCNLYQYDTNAHQISLVAVLSGGDDPDWGEFETALEKLTARSSPDGRYFTFMSQRRLTGYDNRDAKSGQPDEEVYLFDSATGALDCVSCNPTGARPQGVFDPPRETFPGLLVDHRRSWSERWLSGSIPAWTEKDVISALYQSRFLSNSGRLFFTAADSLVPTDTNGVMDVYQYEPPGVGDCTAVSSTFSNASGGCVGLISSGTSPEESAFLDASENGDDVFFLTASQLTAKDTDHALDVYDARVGGGEPQVLNPPACAGDACQQPAVPPSEPTISTSVPSGPGDLLQCPKGKVKKSGKCVAKRHKAKKHRKKGHKKQRRAASHNRGGQK